MACENAAPLISTNLSTGADTVMYLLREDPSGYVEVAYSDDYGGSLRSKITYTNIGSSAWFQVLVRANGNGSGGSGGMTFEILHDGSSYGTHRLGGYIATDVDPATAETMETVLVNNGAPDTLLIRLVYTTHWEFSNWDFTSGVGTASKLAGTGTNQRWIVATPAEAYREGGVRLVRNDAAYYDTDQDGLGDGLEVEACTCSSRTGSICGFTCSSIPADSTPQDTDSDGLRDNYELIGKEDASFPQLFPLWGASPTHKDVFEEVDRSSWEGSLAPGLSEDSAIWINSRFTSLNLVTNPDGTTGIKVHFDIGDYDVCDQETGDVDQVTDVCGNFGGSNNICTPPPDGYCYHNVDLSSVRSNLFHWSVSVISGSSSAGVPDYRLCTPSGNKYIYAHELGHNLGLQHWGVDSAGRINRKPNYPSMMNYSYSYGIEGTNDVLFSDGTRGPLDPTNLSETTNYSGDSTDIEFLKTGGQFDFPSNAANGHPRWLDWNRDGDFDSGVRAYIAPQSRRNDYEAPEAPVNMDLANVPGSTTTLGPAAARFDAWEPIDNWWDPDGMWLVVSDPTTHRLRYNTTAGDYGAGIWSGWADLSTAVFDSGSEPFAIAFTANGQNRLTVFASFWGYIYYGRFQRTGVLDGNWTLLSNPANVTFNSVSAAVLGNYLYVVARNTSTTNPNEVWYGNFNSSGTWSGWYRVNDLNDSNRPVLSYYTPGLAAGPEGALYLITKQARSGTGLRLNKLELYMAGFGAWARIIDQNLWALGDDGCNPSGRPSLQFRPHLDQYGRPLASGNGALWLWHTVYGWQCSTMGSNNPNWRHRWTWGKFNSTVRQNFQVGWWHSVPMTNACGGGGVLQDTGVGTLVHGNNLAAFTTHTGCPDTIYHVPWADGQHAPPNLIRDTNDHSVMASTLCVSINTSQTCKCMDFNASCGSKAVVESEPVECGGNTDWQ